MALPEPAATTGSITSAPASVLSAVATKAFSAPREKAPTGFAPAPADSPVLPPASLPEATPQPEPVIASAEKPPAMPAGATALEVLGNVVTLGDDMEMIGGVACPVDPMERLQCESCQ